MHGRRTVVNYNRFAIRTLFGAATNCTYQLPPPPSPTSLPCPALPPLFYSYFIFYIAIFSNLSLFLSSLSSCLLLVSSLVRICSYSLQHSSLTLYPHSPTFHLVPPQPTSTQWECFQVQNRAACSNKMWGLLSLVKIKSMSTFLGKISYLHCY